MLDSKGAQAPFFIEGCVARLRDDALLAGAAAAFAAGAHADALLSVEYVCRHLPGNRYPAMLRAAIVHACHPELSAQAWYHAWCTDPEHPQLQDRLLQCWLDSGAHARVRALGSTFLPPRCRAGTAAPLVALLRQAGAELIGACWKAGTHIEGMLFGPPGMTPAPVYASTDTRQWRYLVPADGSRFRFAAPLEGAVWSLTLGEQPGAALLAGSPLAFAPLAPALPPANATSPARAVAIVLPVYRDLDAVRACIDSVLASLPLNRTPAELVVVDDASPEPALAAWLTGLAAAGRITLLRNRHNLGFIGATNRGLAACPAHDALMLNADTLVHGDWIDRLRASLYSSADVASVTPWSNNGEISSFPVIGQIAAAPGLAALAQIDSAAAALHAAAVVTDVELPVCCGFAMLMRRSVLDQIGALDGVALQRGYSEEVDWCLRAGAAGYRHLAATGVFIAHAGGLSFGSEKVLRVRQHRAVIAARYPAFYPRYQAFVRADPLGAARAALRGALAGHAWLQAAPRAPEHAPAHAALPAPLPAAAQRIAVWQHRTDSPYAPRILELARLIAARPPASPPLRLLVVGHASEALWRTGVVDVLPPLPPDANLPQALLSDAALLGLAGCTDLLLLNDTPAPALPRQVRVDDQFVPRAWLAAWQERRLPARPPGLPLTDPIPA